MIKFLIGGDFCPIGRLQMQEVAIIQNSGQIQSIMEAADCTVINLECPLTDSERGIKKRGPRIKANPSAIRILAELGVNLVTLANNHIMDYGEKGLSDTIDVCVNANIDTVGAGLILSESGKIYFTELKGKRIAVINMCEREFSTASFNYGGANGFDLISAMDCIRVAQRNADFIFLIIHGGLENYHFPSPESVRRLRFLAEQGCTAIIRHHSHCVQGYEVWKGVPIFYSLGNFLFEWYVPIKLGNWYEGILVEFIIDDHDKCTFDIIPFEQCKTEPGIKLLEGDDKSAFMKKLSQWSVTIADETMLKHEWHSEIERRKFDYFGLLRLPFPYLFRLARKLRLLKFVKPSKNYMLQLENYLRCETHREILTDILEREREQDRYSR